MNINTPNNEIRNPYERSFFAELMEKIKKKGLAHFIDHEPRIYYFSPEGESKFIKPDFVIRGNTHQIKIAVEIDGRQHEKQEAKISDAMRDETLIEMGYYVMRFASREVNDYLDGCIEMLKEKLAFLEREAIMAAQRRKMYQLTQRERLGIAA